MVGDLKCLSAMALEFYSKHLEGTQVSDARVGTVRFTETGKQAFEKLPEHRLRMSTVKALRELVRRAVPTEDLQLGANQPNMTFVHAVVPVRVGENVYAVRIVLRKVGDEFHFEDFQGYGMPSMR